MSPDAILNPLQKGLALSVGLGTAGLYRGGWFKARGNGPMTFHITLKKMIDGTFARVPLAFSSAINLICAS